MHSAGEREGAVASKKGVTREARLASALRENLKRRKSQAQAKAKSALEPAGTLGTAPQAGLESDPSPSQKAAPKRM